MALSGRERAIQPRKRRTRVNPLHALIKPPTKADRFIRMLELAGLGPFEPEWQFALKLGRKWAFDVAWPSLMVAVEIEGGIWAKDSGPPCPTCGQKQRGAHGSGSGILRDIEKYNAGTILGWRIIRIPTGAVTWESVRMVAALLSLVARNGERPKPGRVMAVSRQLSRRHDKQP